MMQLQYRNWWWLQKGRASYPGERLVGHPNPGAVSSGYWSFTPHWHGGNLYEFRIVVVSWCPRNWSQVFKGLLCASCPWRSWLRLLVVWWAPSLNSAWRKLHGRLMQIAWMNLVFKILVGQMNGNAIINGVIKRSIYTIRRPAEYRRCGKIHCYTLFSESAQSASPKPRDKGQQHNSCLITPEKCVNSCIQMQ